jgi:hypothetical protein
MIPPASVSPYFGCTDDNISIVKIDVPLTLLRQEAKVPTINNKYA